MSPVIEERRITHRLRRDVYAYTRKQFAFNVIAYYIIIVLLYPKYNPYSASTA